MLKTNLTLLFLLILNFNIKTQIMPLNPSGMSGSQDTDNVIYDFLDSNSKLKFNIAKMRNYPITEQKIQEILSFYYKKNKTQILSYYKQILKLDKLTKLLLKNNFNTFKQKENQEVIIKKNLIYLLNDQKYELEILNKNLNNLDFEAFAKESKKLIKYIKQDKVLSQIKLFNNKYKNLTQNQLNSKVKNNFKACYKELYQILNVSTKLNFLRNINIPNHQNVSILDIYKDIILLLITYSIILGIPIYTCFSCAMFILFVIIATGGGALTAALLYLSHINVITNILISASVILSCTDFAIAILWITFFCYKGGLSIIELMVNYNKDLKENLKEKLEKIKINKAINNTNVIFVQELIKEAKEFKYIASKLHNTILIEIERLKQNNSLNETKLTISKNKINNLLDFMNNEDISIYNAQPDFFNPEEFLKII